MSESRKQLTKDRAQESSRKPYSVPQLTRHGTVVELTHSPIPADVTTASLPDFAIQP